MTVFDGVLENTVCFFFGSLNDDLMSFLGITFFYCNDCVQWGGLVIW